MKRIHRMLYGLGGIILLLTLAAAIVGSQRHSDFWITADHRAARLEKDGQFGEAARLYHDPQRQGVALYRAGEFEKAAEAFARSGGAAGAYNHATALLMHGAYDASIKAYDRALAIEPGWKEAADNRNLAFARKARMESRHTDDETSDLKPDGIVIDNKKPNDDAPPVQLNRGEALSDEALRAQWLRRVQTRPADFLKARFAYERQASPPAIP